MPDGRSRKNIRQEEETIYRAVHAWIWEDKKVRAPWRIWRKKALEVVVERGFERHLKRLREYLDWAKRSLASEKGWAQRHLHRILTDIGFELGWVVTKKANFHFRLDGLQATYIEVLHAMQKQPYWKLKSIPWLMILARYYRDDMPLWTTISYAFGGDIAYRQALWELYKYEKQYQDLIIDAMVFRLYKPKIFGKKKGG